MQKLYAMLSRLHMALEQDESAVIAVVHQRWQQTTIAEAFDYHR